MSSGIANQDKRLARMVLATAWLAVLIVLTWYGWRDYQRNLAHQESLARQAANAGAQRAALYFQDVNNRLLQLVDKEEETLNHLHAHPGDSDALHRLKTALKYRFAAMEGFGLIDTNGVALLEEPPGHSTLHKGSSAVARSDSSAPLLLRTSDAGVYFDVTVPWFVDRARQGVLVLTLGCDYLCASLRTQAPVNHSLRLHAEPTGEKDTFRDTHSLAANIPGTQWSVIDQLDSHTLDRQFQQFLLIAGLLLILFLTASLLVYRFLRQRAWALAGEGVHFRELFDTAGMAKLVVDRHSGNILELNRAAMDFFRRPEQQLRHVQAEHLLGLDEGILMLHAEVLQRGESSHFQTDYADEDGSKRHLEICISRVGGQEHGMLQLVLHDITERIESMQALKENEQKLSAILDASADGIVLTDEAGLIQVFNPAAEMMFGYLREEIVDRHIGMLMPSSFNDGQEDAGLSHWLPEGITSGQGVTREIPGERIDGEEIPIRISLNRVSLAGRLHFVALIQDLTDMYRNERKLDFLERRDVLTGLLNRREFERRLDSLLSFSDQPEIEHVLCYMDVDQFKLVNDTCGHVAGDQLLKQIAMLVKSQLKESETIARIGGDEFGALLTDCTVERAEQICTALLQTIRNFLFTWQDQSFDVAVSIGIAGFRAHSVGTTDVLSEADVACHMAKHLGRDRIHTYHQGDVDLIRHHGDMHLVSVINQALSEGRFHLYAQPIVPVPTANRAENTHYEILVRMVDKNGRMVIPDKFIPAAERYILMPAIDRWVITELFTRQGDSLRQWAETHQQGFLFGINLSGTSITDDGFLNYLKRQFKDYTIPYRSICFEITETAAVGNLERAKALIEELKALGCSFALDDFGTGLSSYAYLKVLPVDYLKIDGSFVRNMADDPVDYAMVDSINHIGHILGLKTIAEWAEDASTLIQLRALNVDYAQGYGVGDIVSVQDFKLSPTQSHTATAATPSDDSQRRVHPTH